MIELGFELGMTAAQVEENLLERDLVMYLKYAEKHGGLPNRRLLIQTAMVAQHVHADSSRPLSHYIVGWPAPTDTGDETAEAVGEVFAAVAGGNVVMLKGRKKKVV